MDRTTDCLLVAEWVADLLADLLDLHLKDLVRLFIGDVPVYFRAASDWLFLSIYLRCFFGAQPTDTV